MWFILCLVISVSIFMTELGTLAFICYKFASSSRHMYYTPLCFYSFSFKLYLLLWMEACTNKHAPVSGYHTLYEWYQTVESEHFPDPTGLRARIEQWTFGLYPACIKYLMSAFDVPEVQTSFYNYLYKDIYPEFSLRTCYLLNLLNL